MQIIKQGDPQAKLPWYSQLQIGCGSCGALFRIEPGDPVKEYDDQRDGSGLTVACPCCQQTIDVSRPSWTYQVTVGTTVTRSIDPQGQE